MSEFYEEDAWEEIVKLSRDEPCAHRAVQMVQSRGVSVTEAALQLALAQTKRIMILQDQLVNFHKLSPPPMRIVVSNERLEELMIEFKQTPRTRPVDLQSGRDGE